MCEERSLINASQSACDTNEYNLLSSTENKTPDDCTVTYGPKTYFCLTSPHMNPPLPRTYLIGEEIVLLLFFVVVFFFLFFFFHCWPHYIFGPRQVKMILWRYRTAKFPDQSPHPRSLVSACLCCLLSHLISNYRIFLSRVARKRVFRLSVESLFLRECPAP